MLSERRPPVTKTLLALIAASGAIMLLAIRGAYDLVILLLNWLSP